MGVTVDLSLGLMRGYPQHLVERGWDVHVVSSPGAALDALAAEPGIRTHAVVMAREPSPAADLWALFKWVALVRRIRPDLLTVGTPKAGLLGGIAGWLTRTPHRLYTLRGLRLETTTGVKRSMLGLLERVAMGASHRVIAVSPSLRERSIALGLVSADKVVVVGDGSSNGVDVEKFAVDRFRQSDIARLRAELGIIEDVPVVGFVGRLAKDKGLDELAEARTILESQGIDYQFLVVGGSDDETSEASLKLMRSTGRRTIETGHVSDPAIYFQLIDILCLPTLREGFPSVVLEAGAAGLPTVTTDATGARDSVIDGVTGVIVHVGNANSLAEGLRTLICDSTVRLHMGARAHEHVTARYSRQVVWQGLDKLQSELIAEDLR